MSAICSHTGRIKMIKARVGAAGFEGAGIGQRGGDAVAGPGGHQLAAPAGRRPGLIAR